MSTLRICLLGGLTLAGEDTPLPPIPSVAARSLLAYLVTYRDRAHTRDLLAGTFWPDLPDAVARRRLRQALWQIRRVLRPSGDAPDAALLAEGDTVQFNPDLPLWLDVEEFTGHKAQCSSGGTEAIEHCALCVELYKGDFLAGYYDDWVLVERERLREIFLAALGRLAAGLKSQGEYERALLYARRLASEESWREEAHCEVMRLCHLLDRDAEALKQFEVCRQVLAEELGTEPSPETGALAAEIAARSGRSKLPLLPQAARPTIVAGLERPDQLPLVGRQPELAELLRQVEAAARGNGGLTLVYGEAGVGKTRLLQELASNARWRGVRTVWGRCYELLAPPAYQPLVEALRAGLPRLKAEVLGPLWQAELSRLLPELATGPDLPPTLSPEEERRRLLEAIARAFLALPGETPCLVLLEDAHWMDPASLEVVRYLSPRLANAPLLMVCTIRTEELAGQQAALVDALRSTRQPHCLELRRLDLVETEELVQRILDLERPAARFSARLYVETEGNPFFLIETLSMLADEGLLQRAADGTWHTLWDESTKDYAELLLPAGVVQSIERRLDRLTAPLLESLGLAAVIGREISFELWQQAGEYSEEELLAVADELCAKGLCLTADPGAGGTDYVFAHDQIRRVTYDRLSAPRRRRGHRRVAKALETLHPDELEALAYHWAQAGGWDRAAGYYQRAGDRARAVYANVEAAEHYTQALTALARLPESPAPDRVFALRLAREAIYNLLGERASQTEDLAALQALAEQLSDVRRQAEVALRRAHYAEAIGDYTAAATAAQEAVALAQVAHDASSEAAGYLSWGQALLRQGEHEAARPRLEQALALARTASLSQIEADSLRSLGLGAYRFGDLGDARAYFVQALEVHREIGDRQGESASLNGLGVFASDQGDFAEARSYYEQSLRICQEIGRRRGEGNAFNNLGLVLHRQEEYAKARACYEQSLLIYRETGDRRGESDTLGNFGLVAQDQGDYAQAITYNEKSLRICQEIGNRPSEGNALSNLGVIAYYLGDYAQARGHLEQALNVCHEINDRRGEGWALSNLGLLFHHLDDRIAQKYSQQAVLIAQTLGDRRLQGHALTSLGHALAGLQDLDEAARVYRRALDLRHELGQSHRAMESQAGLARVCLAQGNLALAQVLVDEILHYLEDNTLEGADEPLRVYLTCYRVSKAGREPRAETILAAAYTLLQERAARISSEELQRSFLENVAVHQEIVTAWHAQQARQVVRQEQVRLPRAAAPTGRALRDDEYVTVTWTVEAPEDGVITGKAARRRAQLCRLLGEASQQDAAPTVDDLAVALDVSRTTLKRDLAALRQAGYKVRTRGSKRPSASGP